MAIGRLLELESMLVVNRFNSEAMVDKLLLDLLDCSSYLISLSHLMHLLTYLILDIIEITGINLKL